MLEFSTDYELHKIAMNLQQIMQWFGYNVIITCKVVTKDRLHEIEQGKEEPNPSPSLDVTGKNFETHTASVQQIEQQVQRVTQNIVDRLVEHVNQQVGQLEAIVSKNTNLNDERQNRDRLDRYHPVQVVQDIAGFLDKQIEFHSKPLNKAFLGWRRYPMKHEISFNRWLFEVRTIKQSYAEPLFREAIIKSVGG